MHVVATAGHVDHGKSTLVKALTGMDPDRFAEEKERGLTIDLGFAWTRLPSGRQLAFVDVPGHVRFIKNMLAGVGAIDACLFVVAATEGWKPQSEEHLRILQLLDAQRGLIALTKVALVDDETRELAHMELEESLAGTFLADSPVVEVDVPAGIGVDSLRAALDGLLAAAPPSPDHGRPRLWIDRVFAAKGSGTVVTGTLAGGWLRVDDDLEAVPLGRRVRVRALQSLQESHDEVPPGSRVAVNVTGVSHDELHRGDALVRPGQWQPTRTFDASLRTLHTLTHPVSPKGAYTAHAGSGEHPSRIRVLAKEAIEPGEAGYVRVHLDTVLPLLPGDRFVLRESGRDETVGGGELLDVAPVLPATKARPTRSVDRVIAERGWVDADELERITGERRAATVGHWVVDEAARKALLAALREAVEQAGPLGLDQASLDERQRLLVPQLEGVEADGGRLRPAGATDPLAGHPFLGELERAVFAPPEPAGVDRAVLHEMVRRGLVVAQDGVYFAPSAVEEAGRVVARLLGHHPEGFTVAQLRDALGTTRKHALPMLAILDSSGVTRRRGDLRIGGPRLPTA